MRVLLLLPFLGPGGGGVRGFQRFASRRHGSPWSSAASAAFDASSSEPKPKPKERLDALLLRRGLVASRSQATALIKEGAVVVGSKVATKPGLRVARDAEVSLPGGALTRYVSRGGEKLHAALERWPALSPLGKSVLDVGASTGGYADCCLQSGARRVDCLDVGTGQLHQTLLEDPRVRNFEGVNCRHEAEIAATGVDDGYDFVVIDVSFISLRLILPCAWRRARADLVCLVKPQFEAGKSVVNKGRGVVRDAGDRRAALDSIVAFCETALDDCDVRDFFECPVYEPKGNREYLLHLARRPRDARD